MSTTPQGTVPAHHSKNRKRLSLAHTRCHLLRRTCRRELHVGLLIHQLVPTSYRRHDVWSCPAAVLSHHISRSILELLESQLITRPTKAERRLPESVPAQDISARDVLARISPIPGTLRRSVSLSFQMVEAETTSSRPLSMRERALLRYFTCARTRSTTVEIACRGFGDEHLEELALLIKFLRTLADRVRASPSRPSGESHLSHTDEMGICNGRV